MFIHSKTEKSAVWTDSTNEEKTPQDHKYRQVWADLSQDTFREEIKTCQDVEDLLAGIGRSFKLLQDYDVTDPYAPESPLIMNLGLFSGTDVMTGLRTFFSAYSPLKTSKTGMPSAMWSAASGKFGTKLACAGVDEMIFTGRCEKWSYLVIEGDKESRSFTLHDASDIMGMTTHEKILWLADRYEDAHFGVLGPSGENWQGNRFAGIAISTENQLKSRDPKPRFAGRGGMGNLMGSKNLVAIVAKAPDPKGRVSPVIKAVNVEISRGDGSRNYRDKRKNNGAGGTWRNYPPLHKAGILPENNFRPQGAEGPANQYRDTFEESYYVKDESCFKCGIACHKNVYEAVEDNGKKKPGEFFVKLDYEPMNLMSTNLSIYDQAQTLEVVELTDDMGFDSISLGVVLGYAMEYNERRDQGAPGEKILDGIKFGDFEAIVDLTRRCAEGELPQLGQGVMRLSEELGETDYAMHCKGVELPAYLPETNPGYPFAIAGGHMSMRTFLFLIFEEETSLDYWEDAILNRGIHYTRDDLIGTCKFAGTPDSFILDAIKDWTGVPMTEQELQDGVMRTYLRGLLLERKQGFTDEDYVLPERVYERQEHIKVPQFITPEFWTELRNRVLKGFDKRIEEFGLVTAVS